MKHSDETSPRQINTRPIKIQRAVEKLRKFTFCTFGSQGSESSYKMKKERRHGSEKKELANCLLLTISKLKILKPQLSKAIIRCSQSGA